MQFEEFVNKIQNKLAAIQQEKLQEKLESAAKEYALDQIRIQAARLLNGLNARFVITPGTSNEDYVDAIISGHGIRIEYGKILEEKRMAAESFQEIQHESFTDLIQESILSQIG
ncbi:hypothetical protein ACX93W_01905 [Paenibacillus sp. CAU 1782]